MMINTIKFSPGANPALDSLTISSVTDLQALRDQTGPVAHIIGIEDLNAIKESFSSVVHICGKQHRSGEGRQTTRLTATMLKKHPKIPLIIVDYSNAGRAIQGISSLLKNAGVDRNLYFIAMEKGVLDELRMKVVDMKANSPSHFYFLQNIPDDRGLAKIYMGGKEPFIKVRKQIVVAAKNDLPVLVIGESGTGKELVAREIHNRSERGENGGKFLALNCAAISPYLLEPELFGVVPNYLPEMKDGKTGLWEEANDGTLFLDEIGSMLIDHQPKILRALQNKEIIKVGGRKPIPVNARIIAATNRDLIGMIARHEFIADLYSRLSCIPIYTPAIRESPEALETVAQDLWKRITGQPHDKLPRAIVKLLPEYMVLGNFRALLNALNRLHAYMSAENLTTVDKGYFRQAMESPSRLLGSLEAPTGEGGAEAYRAECLRNLRQAARDIRKCKVVLQPLSRGIRPDEKAMNRMLSALQESYEGLDELCMDPSAFYGYETHTKVSHLISKIPGLMDQLRADPAGLPVYWERSLENLYGLTLGRIQHEIMELTQK